MPVVDVSVIIPTCHRETQLLETIASVQRQTGVELEIIVVDDSAGATARDTVASVTDTRLQYMARPEPSRGRPAQVRNDGAQLARGRNRTLWRQCCKYLMRRRRPEWHLA
jgi:glycosyltransferase involved in cell wall biosynthesis